MFQKHPLFWLVVGILATWRLTSIVREEEIASPLRKTVGVEEFGSDPDYWQYPINFIGAVLSCFWCLSVWVGGIVTILLFLFPPLLIPFALSAAAIFLKDWQDSRIVAETEVQGPSDVGDLPGSYGSD